MNANANAKEIREHLTLVTKALNAGQPVDPEWFIVLHGDIANLEELAAQAAARTFTYPDAETAVIARNMKRNEGEAGRCIVCRAPASNKSAWWVHPLMSDYGVLWHNDATEAEYEYDTMGAQPLGPECAKKIPAQFRVKG